MLRRNCFQAHARTALPERNRQCLELLAEVERLTTCNKLLVDACDGAMGHLIEMDDWEPGECDVCARIEDAIETAKGTP